MMRKAKIMGAAGVAMLAVSSLAGCADVTLPKPVAADVSEHPALTAERLEALDEALFGAINAADEALDGDGVAARMSGPALVERRFAYQKKQLLGDANELPAISSNVIQSAVSGAADYPRVIVQIMEAPEGQNLQTVDVIVQNGARTNWSLWSILQILPGATVPSIATGETGADTLNIDEADGLVASPNAVLDAYISLNQTREGVQGLTFAEDTFRTRLAQSQDQNAQAVQDIGEASLTFSRGGEGPFAVRTADGGALVIGELNYESMIHVTDEGGSATIPENHDIALAARGEANASLKITGTMKANYTATVAFHVPAANAEDKTIKVVAVSSGVPFSVTNEDAS